MCMYTHSPAVGKAGYASRCVPLVLDTSSALGSCQAFATSIASIAWLASCACAEEADLVFV